MKPIYVFGHRNPDNDSVCSAVAYAHLKNLTDSDNVYVPARLGKAPRETAWVFERFGVDLPQEITHMHTCVGDVMTSEVVTTQTTAPMLEAASVMREVNLRALPVLDADEKVAGLLTHRGLAMRYLEETEIAGFSEMPVSLALLARAVGGEIVVGDGGMVISGDVRIAASEPQTSTAQIQSGDIVIMGNRKRTQPLALEKGAGVLIVTMGDAPAEEVLELARTKGAGVIVTSELTYAAARKVMLAQSVGDIMDTEITFTSADTLLAEASEDLFNSSFRELVVIDDEGKCTGILTRTDVARGGKRRCILVDHNEMSQSAPGIEDATVVEIIDHHRVGDVQSAGPILFYNIPIGSTASIVALRYKELGITPSSSMAGIMLAALLTDTVMLKSPTTTDTDKRLAEELSALADIDMMTFGMELFQSRSAGQSFDVETVLSTDIKEYRAGDLTIGIVQYEAVGLDDVYAHRSELLSRMEEIAAVKGWGVMVLMATDIVREGSEVFAVGKRKVAERALGVDLSSGSAWMEGVLSRKKQIAARFMDAS